MRGIEQGVVQEKLATLKRAIKINILVSEYIDIGDEPEVEMNPLWREALNITLNLSRLAILSSFTDVIKYGNRVNKGLALMLLHKQRTYFENGVLHGELLPGEKLRRETDQFVSDTQASLYAEQYRRTH